jgi:hypothetical protein
MSEPKFKVGDEVEVGVSVNNGGEMATVESYTPDAWRRATIRKLDLTGRYWYMAAWVNPSGRPCRDYACEEHMRPLPKADEPRVAAATTEPECKCADYWNHDPGCAYAAWNQARRKRL